MTRYDSMLLRFKAKYQTRLLMRRHRIWASDRVTVYPYPAEKPFGRFTDLRTGLPYRSPVITESEMRALWGDR